LDYLVNETDILQTTTCADGGQTIKNFQLRLLVTDSLKNAEGEYTYVIHRYTRLNDNSAWIELDTWSARITANAAIVAEGNISYVKLIFPFANSLKWNGNLYNDQPVENYFIAAIGKPATVNATSYPTTITIRQSDYDDIFISRDQRSEVYAYNIGLIYKKIDQRTYFQEPCYGQQKVQKGIIYEQVLIGYGKL
jgi:hypothetical protein